MRQYHVIGVFQDPGEAMAAFDALGDAGFQMTRGRSSGDVIRWTSITSPTCGHISTPTRRRGRRRCDWPARHRRTASSAGRQEPLWGWSREWSRWLFCVLDRRSAPASGPTRSAVAQWASRPGSWPAVSCTAGRCATGIWSMSAGCSWELTSTTGAKQSAVAVLSRFHPEDVEEFNAEVGL